jgi:hypothetical protein
MKSKKIHLVILFCAGVAAMQFGGAWKAFSHSTKDLPAVGSPVATEVGFDVGLATTNDGAKGPEAIVSDILLETYVVPTAKKKPVGETLPLESNDAVVQKKEPLIQEQTLPMALENAGSFSSSNSSENNNKFPLLISETGGSSHFTDHTKSSDTTLSASFIPGASGLGSFPPIFANKDVTVNKANQSNGTSSYPDGGTVDSTNPGLVPPPALSENPGDNVVSLEGPSLNGGNSDVSGVSVSIPPITETSRSISAPVATVPDSGLTLGLVGIGLAGVAFFKKRLKVN